MKNKLKRLLNPKIILPTLLSGALLAFILAFADSGQVLGYLVKAVTRAVVPAFFLTLLYLLAKLAQWKIYLARLGLRPGWKELLVPYAGGEIGNSLPLGVYVENYLLKGSLGSGIGRSAAATTWMLITEIGICLLALVAIGVPGWSWVRPLAAFLLVGLISTGLFLFKARFIREGLNRWKPRWKWLQPIQEGTKQFLNGSEQLFSWHTFVYGLPLTAIYLGSHATVLYVVGTVLVGPQDKPWSWMEATSAYAFSMAIVLLVPVLPHLGSVEASGLGVLLQFGVTKNLAVASFLSLRLLTTGTIILVCLIVLVVLRQELALVVSRLSSKRERRQQGQQKEGGERSQRPGPEHTGTPEQEHQRAEA